MSEKPSRDARTEEEASPEEQPRPSKKNASWRRFLTRKWIAIIVGLSVVIHGIGLIYYRLADRTAAETPSPELSLGVFRFETDTNEGGRVVSAEFALNIALLEQIDQPARRRLKARRFRVQQDIEELLRQAHSGDFDDPTLRELKRQLQEQVNETLGMRAIADVIITSLKLQRSDRDVGPMTNTAETVPWVEEPAG